MIISFCSFKSVPIDNSYEIEDSGDKLMGSLTLQRSDKERLSAGDVSSG